MSAHVRAWSVFGSIILSIAKYHFEYRSGRAWPAACSDQLRAPGEWSDQPYPDDTRTDTWRYSKRYSQKCIKCERGHPKYQKYQKYQLCRRTSVPAYFGPPFRCISGCWTSSLRGRLWRLVGPACCACGVRGAASGACGLFGPASGTCRVLGPALLREYQTGLSIC